MDAIPKSGLSRLAYLRLQPFDGGTPEGRAAERYRLAVLAAVANLATRALGLVTMALTVYWAVPYLGAERFGVWATFASMAAMLSFLDLGIGNALVNRTARAAASDDEDALRDIVLAGAGWLTMIGIVTAALLALLAGVLPWTKLLKLSSAALGDEARVAALAFSGLFGLGLLSTGGLKILAGQQRSYEAHLISAVGTLISCVAVWAACAARVDVAGLLFAGFGVRSLVALGAWSLLHRRHDVGRGRLFRSMGRERSVLFRIGPLFFALQIGTMVGWGGDTLLLAALSGAEQVAAFAVVQRLFQLVSQPIAVANAPLWPAYADAAMRADHRFLAATLRRSAGLSIAGAAAVSVLLIWAAPSIIPHWTQGAIEASTTLLALMAAWSVLEAGGNALAMYMNGVGIVREQVIVVICFCVVGLPLKAFAAFHWGAVGLVAATFTAVVSTNVVLYSTVFRRRILAPLHGPRA